MTITFHLDGIDYEADVDHYRPQGRHGLYDPGAEAVLEVSEVRWEEECADCGGTGGLLEYVCTECSGAGCKARVTPDDHGHGLTDAILDALEGEEPIGRYAPQPEEEAWPRDLFGRGGVRR